MKRWNRTWIAVGGAILAGIGASACCVLPVVLVSLGITGAWLSHLRVLEPFRPFLLAGAWLLWGVALVRERRKPPVCEADGACRPRSFTMFWISGALLGILTVSPYLLSLMA